MATRCWPYWGRSWVIRDTAQQRQRSFKSGANCRYPEPNVSDYVSLAAAGSNGRWCHAHGLKSKSQPSYSLVVIDPSKLLAQRDVSRSWLKMIYRAGY